MIENYRIIKEIGKGGMSKVYLARQLASNRLVALKILNENISSDKTYVRRFFREARITAQLVHPNIINVYESNYSPSGAFYIATEYIDGGDFFNFLASSATRTLAGLRQKLEILNKAILALDFAHQKGVVHRDIKPSNILLTKSLEPKLCDFGIATVLWGQESRITQTFEVIGTMDYIAPEQRENFKSVDLRADIYALGVILYQMITAKKPFGAFPPPIQVHPNLPVKLNDIVMKCLQPIAVNRYKSARNLYEDIKQILDESTGDFTVPKTKSFHENPPTAGLSVPSMNPVPAPTELSSQTDHFERIIYKLRTGSISEKINYRSRFLESIDPSREERLLILLKDPETEGVLKETVIEALGKLKSKESGKDLIELLSDPYYNKVAAAAIGEIGCVEAEEKLFKIALAHNQHSYIALLPLGKLNSVKSVDLISEYLTDQHTWIRELAIEALSLIDDPRIVKHLETVSTKDSDPNVRAKSKKILWRIKS